VIPHRLIPFAVGVLCLATLFGSDLCIADKVARFGEVTIRIYDNGPDEMYVGKKKIFSGRIEALPITSAGLPSRIKSVQQRPELNKILILASGQNYIVSKDGSMISVPLIDRNFTTWNMISVQANGKSYEIFSVGAPGTNGGTYVLYQKTAVKISDSTINLAQLKVDPMGTLEYRDEWAGNMFQPNTVKFAASLAKAKPSEIPESIRSAPQSKYEEIFARAALKRPESSTMAPILDPTQPKLFAEGILEMKKEMRERVYGPSHVTDSLVDLYSQIMRGDKKKQHRVMLATGTTGSGKSFSGESLAEYIFSTVAPPPTISPDGKKITSAFGPPIDTQVLTIDASTFKSPDSAMVLFGPQPGSKGFGDNKGLFPTFADTKNPNLPFLIIINEADKASPGFWESIMEILDKGAFTGLDGKVRKLGKGIIYLTANKGSDVIFARQDGKALSAEEVKQRIARFGDKEVKELFIKPDAKNLFDKANTVPDSVVNRIDRAVAVPPVSFEDALAIVRKEADLVEQNMKADYGYAVHLDNRTVQHIVEATFSQEDGVRNPRQKAKGLIDEVENRAALEFDLPAAHELNVSTVTDANGKNPHFVVYNVENPSQSLEMSSELKVQYQSPFKDPEKRAKLKNLKSQLSKRVFGQDVAIDVIDRAFHAKAVNSKLKTPVKIGLFGTSGTGKTELAESVAEVMYGSRSRSKIFAMGNIKHPQQLDNFFGSARGTIGSDTRTELEEFFINNREGGVAIFDEFGNMGETREQKESMRTRFMDLLDRGEYVTSQGERIDLSKFTLVFTSNEGEEIFKGLPSDDLRRATYEEWKDSQKFENFLTENHGYKSALMNRMDGNVILMKPLFEKERFQIAKKEMKKVLDQIQEEHGIGKIEVSNEVYSQIAETFFTHTRGARAIRSLANLDLGSAFSQILLSDKFDDPSMLAKSKIKITLSDNVGYKAFLARPKTAKTRKVILSLRVTSPGQKAQVFEVDVTRRAAEVRAIEKENARRIAIHEAGHAVVNDPKITGAKVEFITIKGAGGYGGYARYSPPSGDHALTREAAVQRVAGMFGGVEGQKAFGFAADAGWSDDLEKARKFAASAVAEYGLSDSSAELPTENGKVIMNNAKTQEEIQKLLSEAQKLAQKRIYERMPAMVAVARELVLKGSIEGIKFDELITTSLSAENRKPSLEKIATTVQRAKARYPGASAEKDCVYKKLLAAIAAQL